MNAEKDYIRFIEDTLIILVLYKIDLYNSKSFISLSNIIKGTDAKMNLFVYNNSPQDSFSEKNGMNINIHYVSDMSNPGVGKAYNEGSKLAQKLGKKWLLLADHDTVFPVNFFYEFDSSILKNPGIQLFVPKLMHKNVLLSPCKYAFHVGMALSQITSGVHNFAKRTVLNSGMLVSVESFSKAGGFNEAIKLDFADFFFINKYKKLYPFFFVTDAVCIHELSYYERDADKTLIRFGIYCRDARTYSEDFSAFIAVAFFVWRRTVKLSFSYKRFSFLKIFFKDFLFQQYKRN